jgi:proteasome lid subunit RPN8/RPN11
MDRKIIIVAQAFESMKADLEQAYPDEGCGFLFGAESDVRRIDHIMQMDNTRDENRRRRFEISPGDYLRAERYALEHDTQLLGVYHSHPDHPARPSDYDLERAVPYFSYLIMSVTHGRGGELRSWQLDAGGQFLEEPLEVEN